MKKQSEKLHKDLSDISEKLGCSFVEAVLEFCQTNQVDPEDLVKQMDSLTLAKLKRSAIKEKMVRKCVFAPSQTLLLE